MNYHRFGMDASKACGLKVPTITSQLSGFWCGVVIHLCNPAGHRTASVDRPHARRRNLDQMAVGIPKIETLATQFPHPPLFHRDTVLRQPSFPAR
jgi:hypothetical protein